jgi:uncharacterized cupredoxin-like copper-binding protein
VRLRLISLLALVSVLVVSSVAYASTQRTAKSSVVVPVKITATLRDYSITFSRASVLKGPTSKTVVFTVKNAGAVAHNIDFTSLNKRTVVFGPGQSRKLTITFKKRGTIQVVCDVPRHIQLGMVTTFKVR